MARTNSLPTAQESYMSLGEPYVPPGADEFVSKVVEVFKSRPRFPLKDFPVIVGCGVYGLYYIGDNPLYRDWLVSEKKRLGTDEVPIYIGKADGKGKRTGNWTPLTLSRDKQLYRRISEHLRSIESASNLLVEDFECRVLVTQPIWAQTVESLLIDEYKPLWNSVIEGFGLHHPGRTRFGQVLSAWDSLHPGRRWYNKMKRKQDPTEIARRVRLEMHERLKVA